MSDDHELAPIRSRVESAMADAFRESDEMVTRWVVLVEVIDTNGERGLWTLAPDDATAWDTLGMLTYATQLEQAALGNLDD